MDRKVQTFDRFSICPFTPKLSMQCKKKVMEIVEDTDHPRESHKCHYHSLMA